MALTIPVRTRIHPVELITDGRRLLDDLAAVSAPQLSALSNEPQQTIIHCLSRLAIGAEPPLQRLERRLIPNPDHHVTISRRHRAPVPAGRRAAQRRVPSGCQWPKGHPRLAGNAIA